MRIIKSVKKESVNGYDIFVGTYRSYDPIFGEFFGRARKSYDVYNGEELVESFNTIKEARNYALEN